MGSALNIHIRRQNLLKLLEQKSRFWKIGTTDKKSLRLQSLKRFHFVKKIIRCYYLLSFLSLVLFDLQPFTAGVLPVVCYVPKGWFYYLLFPMWYISTIAFASTIGTTCLFCSLVTSLIEQFQLLAQGFRDMCNNSRDNIWKELKALVDHNNFLLSYCEELNVAFRSIFLLLFLITIVSASVAIFIFMQPGPLVNRAKCMVHFVVAIIEIGFYCVPLEILITTALKIDSILYDSKWYEIEMIPFKKCLTLITSRAQKLMVFSGHGLVNMNLNTYVLVRLYQNVSSYLMPFSRFVKLFSAFTHT
ncbi:uncharacterized protein LOC135126539 isoform X1 [Zophobas morio]|uniref:uncharacterized protein LOC135126539 isoform X1 n=1 Tax=Zophobas morio TaxID=2755281 RepID=UPI0030836AB3